MDTRSARQMVSCASTTSALSLKTSTTARRKDTIESGSYVVFSTRVFVNTAPARKAIRLLGSQFSARDPPRPPPRSVKVLDTAGGRHETQPMRVIGYVRDAPGPDSGDTVFVQSEHIRRWIAHNRFQLVAVCQDTLGSDAADDRDGYRALLGIISAGHVDTVLISELSVLSADIMVQEIMLADLRMRGVSVVSTHEADLAALADPATDPGRLLIRDVLMKQQTYRGRFSDVADQVAGADSDRDVLIELIPFADEIPARAS